MFVDEFPSLVTPHLTVINLGMTRCRLLSISIRLSSRSLETFLRCGVSEGGWASGRISLLRFEDKEKPHDYLPVITGLLWQHNIHRTLVQKKCRLLNTYPAT